MQHHSVYDDAFVLAMPDLHMSTEEWFKTGRALSPECFLKLDNNYSGYIVNFLIISILLETYIMNASTIHEPNMTYTVRYRAESITMDGASR